MTRHPLVYIIILNWNNWQDTLACVESCRKLTWPNFRIIVVDNGSSDGSEDILRRKLPDIDIMQTGANLGFAGGNNLGINHAMEYGADYIWLLNNDAIADSEALSEMVKALEHDPAAAMAGSKIYYYDSPDTIWYAGGGWEKGRLRVRQRGAGKVDKGQYDTAGPVDSLSGCSLLARVAALKKIGLLDTGYFLYWEDTEWCARARELGFRVLFVPSSRVWHKISGSVGNLSAIQYYYHIRNGFYFLHRFDRQSLPRFVLFSLTFAAVSVLKGNVQVVQGMARGYLDYLRGKRNRIEYALDKKGKRASNATH